MHCKRWNWICHWKLLLGSFCLHDWHLLSRSLWVLLIFPWHHLSNIFIMDTFPPSPYFCYRSSPHCVLDISMLSLETGACISSPAAYFLLQQIYFSAAERECYLLLLSGVIFQWVIHLKLPSCALAKPVKDIKHLMFLGEKFAFKALSVL